MLLGKKLLANYSPVSMWHTYLYYKSKKHFNVALVFLLFSFCMPVYCMYASLALTLIHSVTSDKCLTGHKKTTYLLICQTVVWSLALHVSFCFTFRATPKRRLSLSSVDTPPSDDSRTSLEKASSSSSESGNYFLDAVSFALFLAVAAQC